MPKTKRGPNDPRSCSLCKIEKSAEHFYWKSKQRGQRQSICVPCLKKNRGTTPKDILLTGIARACNKCKKTKSAEEFHFKNADVGRRQATCKQCMRDLPGIPAYRKHGLSEVEFRLLWETQTGCCAVCWTELGSTFVIDHDHEHCPGRYGCSNCVRGILCRSCNSALGLLKESVRITHNASYYLATWKLGVWA